jgi:hypothetical protein
MSGRKTTPEKPPSKRELSIAAKELHKSSATKAEKTLAGRVLSEGAAPEKPPSKRELSIAAKELHKSSATKAEKTLAGRVLSEGAAAARRGGSKST